jgi:hypothetical protein
MVHHRYLAGELWSGGSTNQLLTLIGAGLLGLPAERSGHSTIV